MHWLYTLALLGLFFGFNALGEDRLNLDIFTAPEFSLEERSIVILEEDEDARNHWLLDVFSFRGQESWRRAERGLRASELWNGPIMELRQRLGIARKNKDVQLYGRILDEIYSIGVIAYRAGDCSRAVPHFILYLDMGHLTDYRGPRLFVKAEFAQKVSAAIDDCSLSKSGMREEFRAKKPTPRPQPSLKGPTP